jgi:ribosomal protein L13E
LSEKGKKGKPESKKTEPKRVSIVITKPKGSTPSARVSSRHGIVMVERAGKGFSIGELAGASLPLTMARRWGVPTDSRRRSVLEQNVQMLKGWFTPPQRNEQPVQPKVVRKVEPAKKRAVRKVEPAKKRAVRKVEPAKKRAVRKKKASE